MHRLKLRKHIPLALSMILLSSLLFCNKGVESNNTEANKYTEQFRPQYHFTPDSMWMNDPNGLVYYDGEYHLFYQYYPNDNVWGPMHWGHAVSPDMVHWEHLPIALYPDSLGFIFSGSAVIDWENTTGFGSKNNPPMIAIYTYHDPKGEKAGTNTFQTQGIAYSLDKGRSWTKYKNNPVLPNPGIRDFRDPKVSWHKESGKWVMVFAAHDRVRFYSSPNLKDWTFESDFGMKLGAHGGVWECPDIFPLSTEGSGEEKWVLLVSINPGGPNGGSATQYFVGDYDGKVFRPSSSDTKWLDYGKDNYAGVTWSDVPERDGRRLFIGWMSNWQYATKVPTERWRSAMTIPRELQLEIQNGKYQLVSKPVEETIKLQGKRAKISPQTISGNVEMQIKELDFSVCEMHFEFQPEEGTQHGHTVSFGLSLENNNGEKINLGYDMLSKQFFIDRTLIDMQFSDNNYLSINRAPYTINKTVDVKLFIDASSIELFIDEGKLVMTNILFPSSPFNKLTLYSNLGSVLLKNGEVTELKSIW